MHLFQFMLVSMGRGRRERKRMLHLERESSCVISIVENVEKSRPMPDFQTEQVNPHSLQFPRQLNTTCAQQ